jgi:hypothetical protein
MRTGIVLLLLLTANLVVADETRTIMGRVFDAAGRPVADAAIDYFWSANGRFFDRDGKPIEQSNTEAWKAFWRTQGKMEPFRKATSDAGGRFSFELPTRFHTFMAMDGARKNGAVATIPKDDDGQQIEVRLQPLVNVIGTIEGPASGHRPEWTNVYVEVPEDRTRPLDTCRLAQCSSNEARFSLFLPAGRYMFDAYDGDLQGRLTREVVLTGEQPTVDLGALVLPPCKPAVMRQIETAQASGAMGDYTKHHGEPIADWQITDAKGVSKDAKVTDFRGKWLLLHFWNLDCVVCLGKEPKLAAFYEEHHAERDQFEILAFCIDPDGERKSMADVDRALAPIIEHVWSGKPLPFPVLLDSSMTTIERMGVPGWYTLLIDPEGKLVEGDEQTLAEKLRQ